MPQHPALIETAKAPAKLYLFCSSDWGEDGAGSDIPGPLAALAKANAFKASAGQLVVRADEDGAIVDVLGGLGAGTDGLAVAALSAKLPQADYQIARDGGYRMAHIAAGWVDGAYRFDRYLSDKASPPRLVVGGGADGDAMIREAIAVDRLRDLVNTPAEDMGPPQSRLLWVAYDCQGEEMARTFPFDPRWTSGWHGEPSEEGELGPRTGAGLQSGPLEDADAILPVNAARFEVIERDAEGEPVKVHGPFDMPEVWCE